MNRSITQSMIIQRLTISMPDYLYKKLVNQVPNRQVSRFVADAVEEKLLKKTRISKNPAEEFLKLRKKLPKLNDNAILKAIKKGRE